MPIQYRELQIPHGAIMPGPAGASQMTTPPFEPTVPAADPAPAFDRTPGAAGNGEAATMRFVGGLCNLHLTLDPTLSERFAARFEGPQPEVTEFGDEITIRYHCGPWQWGRTAAEVRLRPDIAWSLRVRGGVSRADIDVRGGDLRGLEISGGVSRMDVTLGEARGTVPVRIQGGVSRVEIDRPAAVPVRLRVQGGASKLTLDTQELGAIGGRTQLESGAFSTASDRYEVEVGGGASRLSVLPR
ncbi:MAG: hypothetical protein ACREQM_21895 [Candidatus Dormibacteraceae bacterium]